MDIKNILQELTCASGVSGLESDAAQVAAKHLQKYAKVTMDKLGNVLGEIGGEGIHIMLDAHIDQIGLIVTGIDDAGFLRVDKCGGMDARILAGHEVIVCGKKPIAGVICSTPPHLSDGKDKDKATPIDELAIDIGMDAKTAKELVRLGDRITLASVSAPLIGEQFCSGALDNRASVAVLLRCIDILSNTSHNCRISVAFTVCEELGGSGAKVASFKVQPDECIAVDVSFAFAPNSPKEKCAALGMGPMIGIAPTLTQSISTNLEEVAIKKEIPYQIEVMGGQTGTNADKISNSGKGVKTGLISIPLKYMHTGIEVVNYQDLENAAKLLAEYILERSAQNHA